VWTVVKFKGKIKNSSFICKLKDSKMRTHRFKTICNTKQFSKGIRENHTLKKSSSLKEMLTSKKLEFIMEAHNGLSAKIVEEAGFKGIWGSGLSISSSLGVRDNNEGKDLLII
jgi:hypothetical protein